MHRVHRSPQQSILSLYTRDTQACSKSLLEVFRLSTQHCSPLLIHAEPKANSRTPSVMFPAHRDDRCAQSGHIRLTNTLRSCGLTHSFDAPAPSFRADLAYTPPIPHLQSRAAVTPRLRCHSLLGRYLAITYTLPLALLHTLGTCLSILPKTLKARTTAHCCYSRIVKFICHQLQVLLQA